MRGLDTNALTCMQSADLRPWLKPNLMCIVYYVKCVPANSCAILCANSCACLIFDEIQMNLIRLVQTKRVYLCIYLYVNL
jgi:hypothetical protein